MYGGEGRFQCGRGRTGGLSVGWGPQVNKFEQVQGGHGGSHVTCSSLMVTWVVITLETPCELRQTRVKTLPSRKLRTRTATMTILTELNVHAINFPNVILMIMETAFIIVFAADKSRKLNCL